MVQFDDVSLSFPSGVVFNHLSFDVGERMHVCVSGPSGKGKSSLLKLIQGYVLPDNGVVRVDGFELNSENIERIRSKMAFIPQNINLPVRNGSELVELIDRKLSENLIFQNMRTLGLSSELFSRSFNEMSGGQKQRIVIAVCLALPRKILLLDEPTASLDDDSIEKLILLIAYQKGKTIISASHNQKWLESSDHIITL